MTFNNIKLEKGLYTSGKSFTQTLESMDPSVNYAGTDLEGLDAFQRQLKRFDIKVSGKGSDSIEKFFRTTDSAALFPESGQLCSSPSSPSAGSIRRSCRI